MKKGSTLFLLGVVVALALGAYSGYVFWQKSGIDAELAAKERGLTNIQNEYMKYEAGLTEQAIAAKQTLAELSDTLIVWSKIIKEIRRTIPVDKKGNQIVEILSYSGSGLNEISMNVKTATTSEEPYLDAADLISAFDKSKYFKENFVPSVSKSKDSQGSEVLTFLFNSRYVGDDLQELLEEKPELEEALREVLTEGLEEEEEMAEEVPLTPVSR